MMAEGEIRAWLQDMQRQNSKETNPARVMALCAGISALQMVLQEES